MTDVELLQQAQSGDLDAWKELYARCLPAVWRQAMALAGDREAAEEIVSDTFLALVRGLSRLDAEQVRIHGWLRGVVRHKAASHHRCIARHNQILNEAHSSSSQEHSSADASAPLETEEKKQSVLKTLDQLPEPQRLVLEWKHMDGLSVRVIAERTGQTEKAVESTLYRARKEFRRLYERNCPDCSQGDSHVASPLEKSL